MATILPPSVPLVGKDGMMDYRWYQYFNEQNLLSLKNPIVTTSFIDFTEMIAPAANATDHARLFVRDNGSGKSQICVIFPTGAIQVIATEP